MRRRKEADEQEGVLQSLPRLRIDDPKLLAELGFRAADAYYPYVAGDSDRYEKEILKAELALKAGIKDRGLEWFEGLVEDLIGDSEDEELNYHVFRYWIRVAAWLETGCMPEHTERFLTMKSKLELAWRKSLDKLETTETVGKYLNFVMYAKSSDSSELMNTALGVALKMLPTPNQLKTWYPAKHVVRDLETVASTLDFDLRQCNEMSKIGGLTNEARRALNVGGSREWLVVRDHLANIFRDLSEGELAEIDDSFMGYFQNSILATEWSVELKVEALEKMARVAKIVRERQVAEIENTPEKLFDGPRRPDGADRILSDSIRGLLEIGKIDEARKLYWYWPWCKAREVLQIAGELMELQRKGLPDLELWIRETKYTFTKLSKANYESPEEIDDSWNRELLWSDLAIARSGDGFYLDSHVNKIRCGRFDDLLGIIIDACERCPDYFSDRVVQAVLARVISWIEKYELGKLELGDIMKLCEILISAMELMGSEYFKSEFFRHIQKNFPELTKKIGS